jgi:hypothetical protein
MSETKDGGANPGSDEARARGCTCPVMDNARGKGWPGGRKNVGGETMFVVAGDCPLHTPPDLADGSSPL